MSTVVVKIGGSLYGLPDLGARLTALITSFPDDRILIFPGGGAAADLVRDWQPQFSWSDAVAHEIAVASLDLNAAMLAKVLPRGCVVNDREAAEAVWQHGGIPILAPSQLFSREEQLHSETVLPHDWNVTSDSLAAWTAIYWPTDELWLCKSVPCPPQDVASAATRGNVDAYFPAISDRLPCVRWCNLRESSVPVVEWFPSITVRSASDGCQ